MLLNVKVSIGCLGRFFFLFPLWNETLLAKVPIDFIHEVPGETHIQLDTYINIMVIKFTSPALHLDGCYIPGTPKSHVVQQRTLQRVRSFAT